jgi:hypothetical protein
MPQLGDYIGLLLSEITIARMQADIETVRISEYYSVHPLLQSFPIPRFRLPNIEMDIPVVIKKVDEQSLTDPTRGAPSLVDMRNKFDEVLNRCLKEINISLTTDINAKLKSALDKRISFFSHPKAVSVDVKQYADDLSEVTNKFLIETFGQLEPKKLEQLENLVKNTARIEFLNLRTPPSRLNVLVTTSEIKEAGPNDIITQIHLKITEEAYEWTTIDSNGQKTNKLVIE